MLQKINEEAARERERLQAEEGDDDERGCDADDVEGDDDFIDDDEIYD